MNTSVRPKTIGSAEAVQSDQFAKAAFLIDCGFQSFTAFNQLREILRRRRLSRIGPNQSFTPSTQTSRIHPVTVIETQNQHDRGKMTNSWRNFENPQEVCAGCRRADLRPDWRCSASDSRRTASRCDIRCWSNGPTWQSNNVSKNLKGSIGKLLTSLYYLRQFCIRPADMFAGAAWRCAAVWKYDVRFPYARH